MVIDKWPKISVITPSLNQADFIERTIDSVLSQNYPNLEYIVIDGGSNDGTLEILKKYDSQIKWISEKDQGQADAINKGLKMATGQILTYLNSDDLYEARALEKVACFFKKNPKTMWVYGKCRIIDENDKEIRKIITWYKNFWLKKYSYNKLLAMDFISQPAVFWRKELTEEIGTFNINEHLVMDYGYWLRAGRKYSAGVINDYLAKFRLHQSSKSSKQFFEASKQALDTAKKYSQGKKIPILFHYLHYFSLNCAYFLLKFF
jgi:glycosyltransferase involved in cell wall biosynthesis